jgi:uncharacterized DUF497 family protein
VDIEFDPDKDAINQRKHGLSLADAQRMDLSISTVSLNTRRDYGEARYRAWGLIDGELYVLAFTPRGNTIRIISFRKANRREEKRYG